MKTIINPSEGSIPLPTMKNLGKRILAFLVVTLVFQFILFPMPALADEAVAQAEAAQSNTINSIDLANIKADASTPTLDINHLPQEPEYKVISTSVHKMTAYNSEVGQTDNSPCITANGFNVCEHGTEDTVAANFLKMGTKVRIPELFGDRVFTVRDRMNARHATRVDVWMKDRSSAMKFGVKVAKIEVLE
ncbi:MAG: hypothetical protein NT165_02260 [Candidatus Falkowbacteria bacterium]|nr:hypothetical protein [Candidatus Falkowbacteria bacterium]